LTHCPRERRPGNRSSPNAIRPLVSQDMAQLCEKQQGVSWTYDGPNGTETLEGNGFNLCDLRGLLQKGLSDFRLSAFERVFDGPQIATFAIAETAAITRPGTIVPSKTPGMIYSSIAPRTTFHGNATIHIGPQSPNEAGGGTRREFPCTSTRGLVDRRDSNRRCAPKSLPARAADRRNETRLTRLRLAFRARAGQLPWAKKRRRYPRSTRHFPEIWHSRRRKAHRSPFLEWSNYQGDTRHGGPNASTDQS
jgi:hypothetical protein